MGRVTTCSGETPSLALRLVFGLALGLAFGASLAQARPSEVGSAEGGGGFAICPGVRWMPGSPRVALTAAERRLVCGDAGRGEGAAAWRRIPPAQARLALRAFLQDRGYAEPEFRIGEDGLRVHAGPRARITRLRAEGAPAGFDLSRKHDLTGAPLTPGALDELEGWSRRELTLLGYPCPVVSSEADAATGEVRLRLRPGPAQSFHTVREEPVPGVTPGTLRRYDAFRLGDPFRADRLELTQRRLLAEGVLQGVYFAAECGERGAVITQRGVPGAPRLLTIGVGANSDGLVFLRGSWRNVRLGAQASLFEVRGDLSFVQQRLLTRYRWYFDERRPRVFLEPAFELLREDTPALTAVTARVRAAVGKQWDFASDSVLFRAGPAFERVQTLVGAGPVNTAFLTLDAELVATGHDFEYFLASPRTGHRAAVTASLSSDALVSDLSAQRLGFSAHRLWNPGGASPPRWVVGVRAGARTTLTAERARGGRLPATFTQRLGGTRDVRGFGFEQLGQDNAALTAGFAGLELRRASGLPLNLQPFAFLDAGALGDAPWRLDAVAAWAPGLGLRWESPVGSFRLMLARGYLSRAVAGGVRENLQLNFTFGEEF